MCFFIFLCLRLPPNLSLPTEIDLGSCLVGDAISVSYSIHNSGGVGRFIVMTQEDYDEKYKDVSIIAIEDFELSHKLASLSSAHPRPF